MNKKISHKEWAIGASIGGIIVLGLATFLIWWILGQILWLAILLGLIITGLVLRTDYQQWKNKPDEDCYKKIPQEGIAAVKGELRQWAEGLSKVSNIPIEQIWTMPSDKIEELRTKYNYR
jgi:thiol:disulfide interchange protein